MRAKRTLLASAASLAIALNVQTALAQAPAPARDPFDNAMRISDSMEPAIPRPEQDTEARLPSEAGYRTALAGKWHLGEAEGTRPHEVGYDEYVGILSVTSELAQGLDARLYPDLVNKPERMEALRKLSEPDVTGGVKGGPTRVVKHLETTEQLGGIDQIFADFSLDFIKRSVAQSKPFFLVHAFARIHNDNYPAPAYPAKHPPA